MSTLVESLTDETFVLNLGPQHPATHGVLRVKLRMDGEYIVERNQYWDTSTACTKRWGKPYLAPVSAKYSPSRLSARPGLQPCLC